MIKQIHQPTHQYSLVPHTSEMLSIAIDTTDERGSSPRPSSINHISLQRDATKFAILYTSHTHDQNVPAVSGERKMLAIPINP